uniref:Uncharacterized protein n=1 Tax=Chelydra serpentina TaxID=8475 RepID=A0A8C3RZK2_CHESE
MVNKDMNGFPVKKCSAFQFFKKRVRRWIKSPMISMEKHQNTNLKYTGSTVMHIPQGEPELESSLCQICLGDHSFQRGIVPQGAESCSWESHRSCKDGFLMGKPFISISNLEYIWSTYNYCAYNCRWCGNGYTKPKLILLIGVC